MKMLFAAIAALLLALPAGAQILEPPELWTGAMHGKTPTTLAGAKVIDADDVARLKKAGALLIDLAERPKKPEKISSDTPWLPVHISIPGAVWLVNAGSGDPSPEMQRRFGERVAKLTGGDSNRPVVTFCHPDCWGSWNAAKRLVRLGYGHVYWFPSGVEGWQEKFAAEPVQEDADWNAMKP
jgi:PQQ-dependent catabolism-associated CXXCW motif protein